MINGSRWSAAIAVVTATACGGSQSAHSELPAADRACLAHERAKIAAGATFQASPTPTAAKGEPVAVVATAIAGNRISGRTQIVPDDDTRMAIKRTGVAKTCPWFKLCLDDQGVPTRIDVIRASCFPRYDADVVDAMRDWRYTPYSIGGTPVPVCTSITICYSQ